MVHVSQGDPSSRAKAVPRVIARKATAPKAAASVLKAAIGVRVRAVARIVRIVANIAAATVRKAIEVRARVGTVLAAIAATTVRVSKYLKSSSKKPDFRFPGVGDNQAHAIVSRKA